MVNGRPEWIDKDGKPDVRVAVMSIPSNQRKTYSVYHVFEDEQQVSDHFESVAKVWPQ